MLDGLLQIELTDAIQIIILYLCVYGVLRYIRGTRSAQVLMGVGVLVLVFLGFTNLFHFDVLARVIYYVLGGFALSMVIIFQHEIRRALAMMGGHAFFSRTQGTLEQLHAPEILAESIMFLSEKRIGALIAIERGISLVGYEEAGIPLQALISRELCISLFTPPQPLHDGGCIIRSGRMAAARCLFPLSNQPDFRFGTRHRAAIGLSEETDSVVCVVSEETGGVSVAYNGKLNRYDDDVHRKVLRWLRFAMPDQRPRHTTFSSWLKSSATRQWNQFAHQAKRRGKHAVH